MTVVQDTARRTLQGFINDHAEASTVKYTDDHRSYLGMVSHQPVKHSVKEYARWASPYQRHRVILVAMLKRGYHGTYHQMSPKRLHRYVNEFAGRRNIREHGTMNQMVNVLAGMVGKRLML